MGPQRLPTGLLFAKLATSREVRLSDRVSKYVPELREHGAADATIEQLLRMRSGLPYYYNLSFVLGSQLRGPPLTAEDRIAELARYELEFAPGSGFMYSNLGYVLLSVIAERATGQAWRTLLRERVFQPAQLEETGVFDETSSAEVARGHLPLEIVPGRTPVLLELPR